MKLYRRAGNRLKKLYIRFCGRKSKLGSAVRKATRLHQEDGKRYRVFFFGYRYHVWDRADIRRQIKNGLFRSGLKAGKDFDSICFFDTNNLNQKQHVSEH